MQLKIPRNKMCVVYDDELVVRGEELEKEDNRLLSKDMEQNKPEHRNSLLDYINSFKEWRKMMMRLDSSLELEDFMIEFITGLNPEIESRACFWYECSGSKHINWAEFTEAFCEIFADVLEKEKKEDADLIDESEEEFGSEVINEMPIEDDRLNEVQDMNENVKAEDAEEEHKTTVEPVAEMEVPEVSRVTPPEIIDPQMVGGAFVRCYYRLLQNRPELLHGLFRDGSVLVRLDPQFGMRSVTTVQGIKDMILSSNLIGCSVEITSPNILGSARGGIFVTVTGDFIGKDDTRKNFGQNFFIDKQEGQFFILTDTLWFTEAHGSLSHSSINANNDNASNLGRDEETEVIRNEMETTDKEDIVTEVCNPCPVTQRKDEEWCIIDSSSLVPSDSNTQQDDAQKTPEKSFFRKLAAKLKFLRH